MKKFLPTMLSVVMALSLAGCGGGSSTQTTEAAKTEAVGAQETSAPSADANYREHLTIAFESQITQLDPQGTGNANEIHAKLFNMTHDSLFSYDPNTGELGPKLATEWEWLDDECTKLHVKLRDDVTFHNGNKLTAEDVEFTLARVSSDTRSI